VSTVTVRRRLLPLAETLGLMAAVTLVGWVVGPADVAMSAPFAAPWTLVTSVYAHAGVFHLVSNAAVVGLAGLPVALTTSRARFHLFFLGTGAVAGVAQLVAGASGVLGASGAAFALVGYVLAANPVVGVVGDFLDVPLRVGVAAVALVAVALTVVLSGAGSALVAHFAGAVLGLLAGWDRTLSAGLDRAR
jgi:membrane associated rhomboid family serine protease